jgi:hypothetical protein
MRCVRNYDERNTETRGQMDWIIDLLRRPGYSPNDADTAVTFRDIYPPRNTFGAIAPPPTPTDVRLLRAPKWLRTHTFINRVQWVLDYASGHNIHGAISIEQNPSCRLPYLRYSQFLSSSTDEELAQAISPICRCAAGCIVDCLSGYHKIGELLQSMRLEAQDAAEIVGLIRNQAKDSAWCYRRVENVLLSTCHS